MLMSVIEGALSAPAYPELAGKRILITGLSSRCGVDIARAFAEHKCRLVLQFAEASEAMEALAEIVAPHALETKMYGQIGHDTEEVAKFARTAIKALGGLDAVINLVPLDACDLLNSAVTPHDVERLVAARLTPAFLISKIIANRMNVLMTEGLVLNVATLGKQSTRRERAFAAVARTSLAVMTRAQSEEWAARGIRFNAVAPPSGMGPDSQNLFGETDIAAVALYLASGRGGALSGHVLEAAVA